MSSTVGTSTQTVKRFFPTPTPAPSTVTDNISQTITVHTNQSFHGTIATDFHTQETDNYGFQTIGVTDDVYLVFPSTPGNIVEAGFHSIDTNGVVLDVQYGGGNGIVGQIPLPAAGGGWDNTAAQTASETDPDGTQTTTTFNVDGTYSLTQNGVLGITTATDALDGAGSSQNPSFAFWNPYPATGTMINVTAPSGVGDNITYTLSAVGPTPTPAPISIGFPSWYGHTPKLASDATTVTGITSIPAGCTAAAFGPTGTQLHEVKSSTDPVFGTTDSETIDTWETATAGPVCEQISDLSTIYYDFTGQSNPVLVGNAIVQTTSTSELLGLQSVTRADAFHRASQAGISARRWFAFAVALAKSRIERRHALERAKRMRGIRTFLKRGLILK